MAFFNTTYVYSRAKCLKAFETVAAYCSKSKISVERYRELSAKIKKCGYASKEKEFEENLLNSNEYLTFLKADIAAMESRRSYQKPYNSIYYLKDLKYASRRKLL